MTRSKLGRAWAWSSLSPGFSYKMLYRVKLTYPCTGTFKVRPTATHVSHIINYLSILLTFWWTTSRFRRYVSWLGHYIGLMGTYSNQIPRVNVRIIPSPRRPRTDRERIRFPTGEFEVVSVFVWLHLTAAAWEDNRPLHSKQNYTVCCTIILSLHLLYRLAADLNACRFWH
jgi:hypothetical protein